MIERIPDLPDHVLGFTAKGQVTAEDYESTLIPAVEDALARHDRVRILYHVDETFTGFEAKAMWDDAKVGLRHLRAWERVAVVTDVDWIRTGVKLFRFVMPRQVRIFQDNELAAARAWVCE